MQLTQKKFWDAALIALISVNCFIVMTVFRIREYLSNEADFQTVLRLGIWAVSFGVCLMLYRLWLSRMLRFDNILFTAFIALNVISVTYAPNFNYSVGCVFSLVALSVLFYTSNAMLKVGTIFNTVFVVMSLVSIVSIIFYFAYPEFGRYREWQNDILVMGIRLTGITGTANHIGFISAFALLLAFYIRRRGYNVLGKLFYIFIVFNLVALLMSISRTSVAALAIAILTASYVRPSSGKILIAALGGIFLLSFLLLIDLDWLFSLLSRSGDAAEITSGTGRTSIWPVIIELIGRKPLLGWGFASSVQVLSDEADKVGFVVASAHSLVLQILLSVGSIGLFLFVTMCVVKLYVSYRNNDDFVIAGLVFIFVIGLSESVPYLAAANTSTLIFIMIFASAYQNEALPLQSRAEQG